MNLRLLILLVCGLSAPTFAAEGVASGAPSAAYSAARLIGGFALIGALLFAFAWFARRGVFPGLKGGGNARLKVVEARSLGQRHALYVVGYGSQRLLVASSPGGVSLLTHLPEARPGEEADVPATPTFAEALMQAVGKS